MQPVYAKRGENRSRRLQKEACGKKTVLPYWEHRLYTYAKCLCKCFACEVDLIDSKVCKLALGRGADDKVSAKPFLDHADLI